MIYFAQLDTGAIKIGTSRNVESRLDQLKSYYGKPLALLGTMPGGRKEEREIHQRFGHLRFGRHEQFKPAQDLLDFIGKPLLVGANPDAVEAVLPDNQLRVVRLELPPEDHRMLRRLAADEETNMALLARRIIQEYIARHGQKGGAK